MMVAVLVRVSVSGASAAVSRLTAPANIVKDIAIATAALKIRFNFIIFKSPFQFVNCVCTSSIEKPVNEKIGGTSQKIASLEAHIASG